MKHLLKHSTANNPVLKVVLAVLFIVLPILGFAFGMQYQQSIDKTELYTYMYNDMVAQDTTNVPMFPTASSVDTTGWKKLTYKNVELQYPSNYVATTGVDSFGVGENAAAFNPDGFYINGSMGLQGIYKTYGPDSVPHDYVTEKDKVVQEMPFGVREAEIVTRNVNGKNQKVYHTVLYYRYNGGVMVIEYTQPLEGPYVLDQIASTLVIRDKENK